MDDGTVILSFDFGVITSWDGMGRAVVEAPKYYRPDLGENLRCCLKHANGTIMEELHCEF